MPRQRTHLLSLTALVVMTAAGGLVGCDDGSDATMKIEQASRALSNISGTDSSEARAAQYQAIANDLRDLKSGEGSTAAAANVLTAQSTAGLGQLALEQAHRQSAEVLGSVAQMRAALEGFIRSKALAVGASRQDFTDQYAELDEQAGRLSDALDEARSRLSGIERSIADLEGERDQRVTASRSLREEAIVLLETVESASATRREPVMAQAREINRRADKLEAEVGELQIQIDDANSRRRSTESDIALFERQREINTTARDQTGNAERQFRQQRDKWRQQAREQGDALLSSYTELLGAYEQGAQSKFEEAAQSFGRAASDASRARNEMPAAGVSVGNIRLMEASTLASRGQTEREIVAMGEALLASLENIGDLRGRVDALRLSANESLSQAAEAYEGASSVIENSDARAAEIRALLGIEPEQEQTFDEDDSFEDDGSTGGPG